MVSNFIFHLRDNYVYLCDVKTTNRAMLKTTNNKINIKYTLHCTDGVRLLVHFFDLKNDLKEIETSTAY